MIKEEFSKIKTFSYNNTEYNILLARDYAINFSKPYNDAISDLVKGDFIKKGMEELLMNDSVISSEMAGKSTVMIYYLEENNLIITFVTNDNRLIL